MVYLPTVAIFILLNKIVTNHAVQTTDLPNFYIISTYMYFISHMKRGTLKKNAVFNSK